jgi:hypothetical protein
MINKTLCILLLISILGFTNYKKPNFALKILSSEIKNGKLVYFELTNNTNYNYCFVMDTLFLNREYPQYYYLDAFYNPKVVLFENNGTKVSELIKDESIPELSINDSTMLGNVDKNIKNKKINRENINLIIVKSHSKIKLKIPFELVTRLDNESISYYRLESGVNYYGKIDYLIEQKFIDKRISIKKKDSVQRIGCRFFTGRLISNKVPLILK